ncbi:ribbon-helix-helix protein, CopG family [Aurantimonas coralicida]|uniref:ribbon-helix-helix protein, CopG family n=1 Tax=Aurantimonas coralicida TaxID=182270 RepID=UPI001E4BABA2|nr:ribbon-helix-helix protein, CopG family [Aurantimonas coralicida]MCD1645357.1 ribbon-helix-helix protein, CopG family [Aurantimonas coralicida]
MDKLRIKLLADRVKRDLSNGTSAGAPPGATTMRVSQKVLKRVDAEAAAEHLSRNELINLLFDQYLRARTGEGIDEIDPEYARQLKAKRRQR